MESRFNDVVVMSSFIIRGGYLIGALSKEQKRKQTELLLLIPTQILRDGLSDSEQLRKDQVYTF